MPQNDEARARAVLADLVSSFEGDAPGARRIADGTGEGTIIFAGTAIRAMLAFASPQPPIACGSQAADGGVGVPTDRYGETAIDRLRDLAENGTLDPQRREDIRALLALANQSAPSTAQEGATVRLDGVWEIERSAQSIWDKRWFFVDAGADPHAEPIETDEPRRFAEQALAALAPSLNAAPSTDGRAMLAGMKPWQLSAAKELGLLYNYRHDDSPQFTRWQMMAAIAHGRKWVETGGWIVGSGDGKRWRTWRDGFSDWTEDREQATRYARREDAEAVHAEDEGAWLVEKFSSHSAGDPGLREALQRIADVSERWEDSLVSQINEIARAALAYTPKAPEAAESEPVSGEAIPAMLFRCRRMAGNMILCAENLDAHDVGTVEAEAVKCAARVLDDAANLLAALQSSPASSDFVRVPREPTEAMLDAGGLAILDGAGDPDVLAVLTQEARQCWAAMLAAAPASSSDGGDRG